MLNMQLNIFKKHRFIQKIKQYSKWMKNNVKFFGKVAKFEDKN